MRLSDLLEAEAVTEAGQSLGHVHDVAFQSSSGDPQGWGASALIVGPLGFTWRLGYARGRSQGPHPLAALARALSGRGHVIPWEAVVAIEPGRVVVSGTRSAFRDLGPEVEA